MLEMSKSYDEIVGYDVLDRFKREAQKRAQETNIHLERFGLEEIPECRGGSAHVVRMQKRQRLTLAHTNEGLGTKNRADRTFIASGETRYKELAQCNAAMIFNDLATVGASPYSFMLHLAVGNKEWFNNEKRWHALIDGTVWSCHLVECTLGGWETAVLIGLVGREEAILSGSASGICRYGHIRRDIEDRDVIMFLPSSGVHANGLSLVYKVMGSMWRHPNTRLSVETTFREALLKPTILYGAVVEDCLRHKARIHYAINITGHGWRKLLRHPDPWLYIVEELPKPQPIFQWIQRRGKLDDREMYKTFNMGAGFALIVPKKDVRTIISISKIFGIEAMVGGHVEKSSEKRVVIKPKGIEFTAKDLEIS